ncbi:MFS transporter [Legionella spiritensis]|uniref:MFS transporter n=1 Tax=Legionella spiritensis TaxID=452 RepID=UPI000F6F8321|nr:MFS transporter [Legionella spiritensis]VEG91778.1 multidrug resistance protein, MFS family [Legionella spiritensis]
MKRTDKNYFAIYNQLDTKCKKFLFLYFIRAISAGIAFFIGIFLAHIHMKWLFIGYEVTALSAGNLLGSWVTAKYSDKVNPLIFSGISLLLQGICFLLIAYSTQPFLLGWTVFLYGFAGYAFIAINHYIITSYSGDSEQIRAQVISFSSMASNIGLLIGGILVSYLSTDYAILLFSLMGIMLIVASLFYFSERKESITIRNSNLNDNTNPNKQIYFTALAATFLLGFIFAQQRIGYQVFLEHHFTSFQISMILGVNTALIVLFLPYVTQRIMQLNHLFALGLGGLILGVGMYLMICSDNYYFILALCVVRTLGEMIAIVMSQFICFQYSPKMARGRAMGNHKLIFAFGILAGSFIGANMLAYWGMKIIWGLCGSLGVVIFIVSSPYIINKKPIFLSR